MIENLQLIASLAAMLSSSCQDYVVVMSGNCSLRWGGVIKKKGTEVQYHCVRDTAGSISCNSCSPYQVDCSKTVQSVQGYPFLCMFES